MKWQAIILVIWVAINVICDSINEYKSTSSRTGRMSSGFGSVIGVVLRYGSWAWLAYECGLRLGISL